VLELGLDWLLSLDDDEMELTLDDVLLRLETLLRLLKEDWLDPLDRLDAELEELTLDRLLGEDGLLTLDGELWLDKLDTELELELDGELELL